MGQGFDSLITMRNFFINQVFQYSFIGNHIGQSIGTEQEYVVRL